MTLWHSWEQSVRIHVGTMKLAEILDTVKLDGVMDKMKMDKLYERIGRLLDREKFREMNAKVCAKLVEKFPLKRLMEGSCTLADDEPLHRRWWCSSTTPLLLTGTNS